MLTARTALAHSMAEDRPALIKGNAPEILALGGAGTGRGTDATDATDAAVSAAQRLAGQTSAIVAITGAVDWITDGDAHGAGSSRSPRR